MLPITFIKIWSFPNFLSFTKFGIPPPPTILHVNYRVQEPHVSHTEINVYAHCPLHLPNIVSKKPSVNHIGSSTSHQKANDRSTMVCQLSDLFGGGGGGYGMLRNFMTSVPTLICSHWWEIVYFIMPALQRSTSKCLFLIFRSWRQFVSLILFCLAWTWTYIYRKKLNCWETRKWHRDFLMRLQLTSR